MAQLGNRECVKVPNRTLKTQLNPHLDLNLIPFLFLIFNQTADDKHEAVECVNVELTFRSFNLLFFCPWENIWFS